MLGLGNILTRGIGPVEPYTGGITSRWPARDNGYTSYSLLDTVGSNHISTTLGQALDFDGVTEHILSNNSAMDFLHGSTKVTMWFVARFDAAEAGGWVGSSNTFADLLMMTVGATGIFYAYLNTSGGGSATRWQGAAGTIVAGETCSFIFSFDIANPTGAVLLKRSLSGGATTYSSISLTRALAVPSGTIALISADDRRRLVVGANVAVATPTGNTFDGVIYCAGIGAFADVEVAKSIIAGGAETGYSWTGVRLDHGTTFSVANCAVGTVPPTTLTDVGTFDATSWLNGTHIPYIPQKGYGGGTYTGGIGATALYSFSTADDSDQGCGISLSSMDTLGDQFTFEAWIYKPAQNGADGMCFVSTVDNAVAAADSRGFMLRNGMASRTQDLDMLQLEVHGASAEDYAATITLASSGWWYCAASIAAGGNPTLYVAKATATALTSKGGGAVGSLDVVDAAGDNRLTIMHRVGSAAGKTQDNCLAGTRVDGLVYHAGVALTEAQLLERFNYSKSRYL